MIKSPGLASGAAVVIVAMSNAATMMKCNCIVDCREEMLIEAMGRQNWIWKHWTWPFYRDEYKFLSYRHDRLTEIA